MRKTIFLLIFFFCIGSILYAEPKRENGLSVHFAPKSASEALGANKSGFMVSQSHDLKLPSERPVFDTPEKLIEYFLNQPQEIQENGIWVVTTNPKAYSADEMKSTEVLKDLCRQKKIPLFFCRGMDLPNGWLGADKFNLAESDNIIEAREIESKANTYADKGDFDKAIELYNEASKITPNPAYVIHDRGMAYLHKGEFDKAISDLSKAMEMSPNEKDFIAQCYNDRGNAYYDSEQYEKSWQDVQKAIELGYKVHPGFIAALKSKGYSK
ncbi:MAG: tetratricopeptide repeat protein [Candidatus Omnitrophota bacterium]